MTSNRYYRSLPRHTAILAVTIALTLIAHPLSGWSAEKSRSSTKSLTSDEKIVQVLNRLGYGPRPGDLERIRRIGIEKYIEQQLNPEKIDDRALESRLAQLGTLTMDTGDLVRAYPPPEALKRLQQSVDKEEEADNSKKPLSKRGLEAFLDPEAVKGGPQQILLELSQQHLLRAVYSERQLYEVMVDFWTNHFNVFWAKGADRYLMTAYQHDVIRPNAMGSFPALLAATSQSPAMLFYLDNWMSIDPNAQERILNARQQRNRRLGLGRRRINNPLPDLSTDKKQPNSESQPKRGRRTGLNENYARELMELHTLGVDGGYSQKDVTEVARCFTGWTLKREGEDIKFNFNSWFHDDGEKVVLGEKIPAGGGKRDGERVLEILIKHPSTARFIATKLVRHFIADEPTEALVSKVAATYTKTNGDIRSMLTTIFTSTEFYSRDNYLSKVKSPLALIASALRAADADTNANRQLLVYLAKMGQPLFLCQPPTGYGDTADKWINTAALVERLNFALALCEGRIAGTTPKLLRNRSESVSVDSVIEQFLYERISSTTRHTIEQEIGILTPEKLPKLVGLLLGSPEFQKM
ncbi:MAG: DUF1800 domain-containing protein [Acidobacteriota bacterium]